MLSIQKHRFYKHIHTAIEIYLVFNLFFTPPKTFLQKQFHLFHLLGNGEKYILNFQVRLMFPNFLSFVFFFYLSRMIIFFISPCSIKYSLQSSHQIFFLFIYFYFFTFFTFHTANFNSSKILVALQRLVLFVIISVHLHLYTQPGLYKFRMFSLNLFLMSSGSIIRN